MQEKYLSPDMSACRCTSGEGTVERDVCLWVWMHPIWFKLRTKAMGQAQVSLALKLLMVQWTVKIITEKQTHLVDLHTECFREWQPPD